LFTSNTKQLTFGFILSFIAYKEEFRLKSI